MADTKAKDKKGRDKEPRSERERVEQNRRERFRELLPVSDVPEDDIMALVRNTEVHPDDVKKLLESGCPVPLAPKILA